MSTPPPTQEPDDGSGTPPRERRRDRRTARGDDAGADADGSGTAVERPELAEVARLRERVSELEAALERKDEELDAVRRQYEALLQGRNGDSAGSVTWRTGGEQWAEDVELEYANCRSQAVERDQSVDDGGSSGGRLRSLLR